LYTTFRNAFKAITMSLKITRSIVIMYKNCLVLKIFYAQLQHCVHNKSIIMNIGERETGCLTRTSNKCVR